MRTWGAHGASHPAWAPGPPPSKSRRCVRTVQYAEQRGEFHIFPVATDFFRLFMIVGSRRIIGICCIFTDAVRFAFTTAPAVVLWIKNLF